MVLFDSSLGRVGTLVVNLYQLIIVLLSCVVDLLFCFV